MSIGSRMPGEVREVVWSAFKMEQAIYKPGFPSPLQWTVRAESEPRRRNLFCPGTVFDAVVEKVRIAGAGLAGLTAAYVLSKANRPVEVRSEEHTSELQSL